MPQFEFMASAESRGGYTNAPKSVQISTSVPFMQCHPGAATNGQPPSYAMRPQIG